MYRRVLVWLLRVIGAVTLVYVVMYSVVTMDIYNTYRRGEVGMTYLLEMMVPLGAALVVGALIALTLAEILALQIKRDPSGLGNAP